MRDLPSVRPARELGPEWGSTHEMDTLKSSKSYSAEEAMLVVALLE